MSDKALTLIIQGTPISPGLAQGIIHVHQSLLGPIDVPIAIEQNNVKEEFSRLDTATARISEELSALGGNKYLFRLFAGGPVTQGSRLANLRAPANATDVSFGTSY